MGDKFYCIAVYQVLNEERLGASHGSIITYSDAVTGFLVSEIGYFLIYLL
ncbi:hypothetical protein [Bacillus nitratireducens]|nr:hypothetical protein [Bacillus nitratireducens]EEL87350.1 hypothetical protein bcere0029_28290 [Bacillus cereus AH1272]EEL90570.1 hypothetical protein bcere0030_55010 [Bacillus cereus AH1273]EOP52724.1 hypothetical protein IKQ_02822 [Bacillus cereus VDM053]GCF76748.1 hypothetical protein BC2926_42890 [Bacillus cereus]SEB16963.1 hypothetical protein SAMN04488146_112144 [Bacillus nitratireducens]